MLLENVVAEAKQRLATPGIEGWGLEAGEVLRCLGGEMIATAPTSGCTTATCQHVSHSPAAPGLRWIPPVGVRIAHLGGETLEDGTRDWYVARGDSGDVFLQLTCPVSYWARLEVVEHVPEWALANVKV